MTAIVPGGARDTSILADYAQRLSQVEDVVRVMTPSEVVVGGHTVSANPTPQSYTASEDARLSVIADVSPTSPAGVQFVEELRDVPAPAGTLIGGVGAEYTDSQAHITERLPAVLAWVAVTTLIVVFLFTGSVVLPLKAILLNVLSLGATLGALVWVFQDGHGRELVGGFTVTGTVDNSMIVLIAITAFALSMDYEVFLLSRIKEEHDLGLDTREAIILSSNSA